MKTKLNEAIGNAEAAEAAKAARAKELLKFVTLGVTAADNYFAAIKAGEASRLSILKQASEFENEDELEAFAQGYRDRGTWLKDHGSASEQAAGKQVYQLASYIDRVRRSIFGVDRRVPKDLAKIKEFNAANGTHAGEADGGKVVRCAGIGPEKVEKILEGKGTFPQKMEQLTATGIGRKKGDGEEPKQSRRAATVDDVLKAATIAPDMGKFATIVGAPTTGENKVEGKALHKLGRDTLCAGIMTAPEEILGDIVVAMLKRMSASSNEVMQEMAQSFRSHWIAQTQAERTTRKAKSGARQTDEATK